MIFWKLRKNVFDLLKASYISSEKLCHPKLALGMGVFIQWQHDSKHLSLPSLPTPYANSLFIGKSHGFAMKYSCVECQAASSCQVSGWQLAWKAAVHVN